VPGLWPLGLDEGRDGLLYVPGTYHSGQRTPLILNLHGARGNEQRGIALLRDFADEYGLLVLAPASKGQTWDALLDSFGPDIDYIDRALTRTFELCAVDPTRLAVGGFSDGASYALSIGLPNGDLFTHVLAFSPVLRRCSRAPELLRRIGHPTPDKCRADPFSNQLRIRAQNTGSSGTVHAGEPPEV
jgi:phospholipase/carboxylesterase